MWSITDEGYFPKGRSVLRRVHGERIVGLLYGGRGLLIGAAEPLTFTGTWLSSRSLRVAPFSRLAHTARTFETIIFGTRAEADHALERVARLHDQVHGTLPEAAASLPAGTAYSAWDPASMLWTLGCIADSGQAVHEALVRGLDPDEREALWGDYARFGELFGMRRDDLPRSYGEFREYWDDRIHGGALELTEDARREGLRSAFGVPLPLRAEPTKLGLNFLLLGTVPAPVRRLYGLTWTPAHEAAFQAAALGLRRSRPLVPGAVRRGQNTSFYDLVTRTERDRRRSARRAAAAGDDQLAA